MLGLLKYPYAHKDVIGKADIRRGPPKCYMDSEGVVVEWILKPLRTDRDMFTKPPDPRNASDVGHRSFDASVTNLADDIAYGVHDIEDGIHRRFVERESWNRAYRGMVLKPSDDWWRRRMVTQNIWGWKDLTEGLFDGPLHIRKWLIGGMVNVLVRSSEVEFVPGFHEPLLQFRLTLSEPAVRFLRFLKTVTKKDIHRSALVTSRNKLGCVVVTRLFEERERDWARRHAGTAPQWRKICDEIANMTDAHALEAYKHLYA